ncbi:MAG: autotransporter domain-containing protein [Candidatus Omnitrophica bacterium]|nr:autotransporter domain-containing protein [Candidatus Omnitrophota bacterium]
MQKFLVVMAVLGVGILTASTVFADVQTVSGSGSTVINSSGISAGVSFTGQGTNESTLTVGDGVNVNTSNNTSGIVTDINGKGNITFAGTSTVSGNVGSSGALLDVITDSNPSAVLTFKNNVYCTSISSTGTIVLDGTLYVTGGGLNVASVTTGSAGLVFIQGNSTPIFASGTVTLIGSSTILISGVTSYNLDHLETGSFSQGSTNIVQLGTHTLTVLGAYSLGSGSELDVTIANASRIGHVLSLNTGSTVSSTAVVSVQVDSYIPNGARFNIVNASGSFGVNVPGTITSTDPRVKFTGSSSNGNLFLTADRSTTGFASLGSNSSTQAAGRALDNVTNPSSSMTTVLNALEGLSNAQTTAALNTMVPVVDAGVRDNSIAALGNFVGASIDRLQNVFNMAFGNPQSTGVSAGDDSKLNGLWAKEYGGYLFQGTDQGIAGYKAWNTGTAVGVDHLFGDTLTVGISGGYAYGKVNSDANSATTAINSAQTTLYARYQDTNHPYFIDAVGSSAWNWYSGNRDISVGALDYSAASNYRGEQYGIYLDGGYTFNLGNKLQWAPLVSFQWEHLAIGHYTETDAGPLDLTVDRQGYDMLESGLGVRLTADQIAAKWGNFTPEVHVKWLHDFTSDGMAVTSAYTGGGGSFITNGIKPSANGVDVGGKLSFDLKNDISIIGGFDAELKPHFFSLGETAEVRYKF